MQLTEKIQRVRVVRIDLRDVFKRLNGGITLTQRPVREPEVVPRSRILRLTPSGVEERVASLSQALRVNQRDALIQPRGSQRRITPQRLPEGFERFSGAPLIHVGDAKIVQADGLRRTVLAERKRCGRKDAEKAQDNPPSGPIHHSLGGSRHPPACSTQRLIASTRSSSHGRPTIWTPIGKPSSERPMGTTAAGFPSRLKYWE